MEVVPSIDISEGKAVKRVKGKRNTGILLGDPIRIAEEIYSEGYDFVHVVDLDAAEGLGDNEKIISSIAKIGFKKLQVGGGIRDYIKASRLISVGVSYIVISTLPFTNFIEFEKIVHDLGSHVMLSIDYCNNIVLIKGWKEKVGTIKEILTHFSKYDIKGVIFTYVCNEGTKNGIDESIDDYISYVRGIKGYAGGISSWEDLIKLKQKGLDFVIVGMSFYSGSIRGIRNV